jgi:hypothetical protein
MFLARFLSSVVTFAAILDVQSEQKVTTIDQSLVRNITAKYDSNPSSGS